MANVLRLLSLLLLTLGLTAGCGDTSSGPTSTERKGDGASRPAVATDPWKETASQLKRTSDAAACRAALFRLNNDLGNLKGADRPAEADAMFLEKLQPAAPLTAQNLDEIKSASFSALDGTYVAECLYLRDVARVLEVEGEPQQKQAAAAFAWVCRQVVLEPWALAALPPTLVLQSGAGSGLERAYAFLSLLQQLGIDGCLIGPPDAGEKQAVSYPESVTATESLHPPGPFWAVGARVGGDILLFDPWRGTPFPGTLAEIRAKPELLKSWYEEKNRPWPLTPEVVKNATVYLTAPLSSFSPRMQWLDKKLAAEVGVHLSVDPAALRARFEEAKAAPKFWRPQRNSFAYSHTLALNAQDGGEWEKKVQLSQVPAVRAEQLAELAGAQRLLKERIVNSARGDFFANFLTPPTAQQRLQRGEFQEASRSLVEKQDHFQRGLELARSDRSEVLPWVKKANELYGAFERARLDNDAAALADLNAQLEKHWKSGGRVPQMLVDSLIAPIGVAEATYLLALCKHEMAERAQTRADRAAEGDKARLREAAREDWTVARDAWASYDFRTSAAAQPPARLAHAKTLAGRAAAMAEAK